MPLSLTAEVHALLFTDWEGRAEARVAKARMEVEVFMFEDCGEAGLQCDELFAWMSN